MKKLLTLLAAMAMVATSFAQYDFTLQHLPLTFQRTYSNPALVPNVKVHIGLPLLSHSYFNVANTGFKAKHLFDIDNDTLHFTFSNVVDNLEDNNSILFSNREDLFSFGLRVGKNYFSTHISEKIYADFRYPKDFFEFLVYGNGAYLGEEMNFNFAFNGIHYTEMALAFSRQWTGKLQAGARVKYYIGRENVQTETADFKLTTAASDFTITANSNFRMNTAGVAGIDSHYSAIQSVEDAIFTNNTGFGLDLGAVYELNEKIVLSASVVDIGYINWRENVKNYSSQGENTFIFSGFDFNTFFSDTSDFDSGMDELTDSLGQLFTIEETEEAYSQRMPTQMYAGAMFRLTQRFNAGVTLFGQSWQDRFRPGVSVYGSAQLGKVMGLALSYSIYNNNFTNLGLGLSFNAGPIQFYAAGNNTLGIFSWRNAQNFDLHFGMNLTFGREAPKKQQVEG